MKRLIICLSLALLALPSLTAQTTTPSLSYPSSSGKSVSAGQKAKKAKKTALSVKPFSRLALSGGVGAMGINMQAATNVNKYLNLRGTGNYFNYTISNISTNGFNVGGKVNMATGGASLDLYPFPNHGFRLSPGMQFVNHNQISVDAVLASSTSFTLNEQKYYSESAAPVTVIGNLGLNANQKAFTMTTGWGNMIPRRGGHWSFPLEIGAAFTGVPTLNIGLTGYACASQADATSTNPGPSCVNMATNSLAQSNLTTQVSTWKNDLNPLKVYPIFTFGVSYNFKIR